MTLAFHKYLNVPGSASMRCRFTRRAFQKYVWPSRGRGIGFPSRSHALPLDEYCDLENDTSDVTLDDILGDSGTATPPPYQTTPRFKERWAPPLERLSNDGLASASNLFTNSHTLSLANAPANPTTINIAAHTVLTIAFRVSLSYLLVSDIRIDVNLLAGSGGV